MKLLELLGMYQEKGSVLVFVERQESADLLLKDLMRASYPCLALHGGIDQYDRDSIIQVWVECVCLVGSRVTMMATSPHSFVNH